MNDFARKLRGTIIFDQVHQFERDGWLVTQCYLDGRLAELIVRRKK